MIKTYSPKPAELSHDWYVVDADGATLGRLATTVATYLLGKHKPRYAPHLDCGDNIVVINSAKIAVTGQKLTDKLYHRHSGHPGGITSVSLQERLAKNPNAVIEDAVRRMLPQNRLNSVRMARLRVYATAEHNHAGQSPQPLGVK